MPITEDAKDLLRERLKLARQAKLDKKNKVAEAINKTEKVEPKPVVQPATGTVQPVDNPAKVEVTSVQVEVEKPTDSATTLPKAKKVQLPKSNEVDSQIANVNKQKKSKYAKLVFYQEPTSKKMKKLTKIMDDSSDSEDSAFHYKNEPVQETSSQQLQYNKLSQLSRMIFD